MTRGLVGAFVFSHSNVATRTTRGPVSAANPRTRTRPVRYAPAAHASHDFFPV